MNISASLLAALFFGLCSSLACGQNKVFGTVEADSGQRLPYANVILLQAKDSATVKGTLANAEGEYAFEQVAPGDYLLLGYLLGYQKTYTASFPVQQPQTEGPVLALSRGSQQLREVQVKGQKPFVEQTLDRTILNVANSVVSGGSTALEVLAKAPGVTLDPQSGQLQLQGRDGVLVQINGRPSYLSAQQVVAMLQSLPSEQIDRIEILTQPSARNDAGGSAGVINLRLKVNQEVGTSGSFSVTGGSGHRPRERSNLQLNHNGGKFNASAAYGFDREGNFFSFRFFRDQTFDGQTRTIHQQSALRQLTLTHSLRANLDYALSRATTLGLNLNTFWVSDRDRGPALTYIYHGEKQPFQVARTGKTIDSHTGNQVLNLNLRHQFRDQKGELTVDVDGGRYTSFFANRLSTLLEHRVGVQRTDWSGLQTEIPTYLAMRVAKADLSRTVLGDWKLETGFKSSRVITDNDVRVATELGPDSDRSSRFKYAESINAGYLSLAGNLAPKTEVEAGLRVEHTASTSSYNGGQRQVKRNYLDFFPSLFLSQELDAEHSLRFAYSYRIDRPGYQDFNPSYSFIDPYSYYGGNPNLRPQYTHSLELRHGFRNKVFTALGATRAYDYIFLANRLANDHAHYITNENLDVRQGYTLTIDFPLALTKGWNLQANLTGLYHRYQYVYHDTALEFSQAASRLTLTNTVSLPFDIRLEVAGRYSTPSVWGIWQREQRSSLDVGLMKTVASRLKVRLSAQDLLYTDRLIMTLNMPDAAGKVKVSQDSRFFLLGLTYDVGNQQLKTSRRRSSGSEEEMNRVGGGNGF